MEVLGNLELIDIFIKFSVSEITKYSFLNCMSQTVRPSSCDLEQKIIIKIFLTIESIISGYFNKIVFRKTGMDNLD